MNVIIHIFLIYSYKVCRKQKKFMKIIICMFYESVHRHE